MGPKGDDVQSTSRVNFWKSVRLDGGGLRVQSKFFRGCIGCLDMGICDASACLEIRRVEPGGDRLWCHGYREGVRHGKGYEVTLIK